MVPFPVLPPSSGHSYWSLISTLYKNLSSQTAVTSRVPHVMPNLQPSSDLSFQQHLPWLIPPFSLIFLTRLLGQPLFWSPPTSLASPETFLSFFLEFSPQLPCLPSIFTPSMISSSPVALYTVENLWLPIFIFSTLSMHLQSRFICLSYN